MPKETLRVITLGCSKNTVDTEHLLYRVKDQYEILPEDSGERTDVLLVNTCGFIGDAKEESVQAILEAASLKQEGKVGRLIVFGCLSQRYPDELPGLIPEVDAWFGARDQGPLLEELGCKGGDSSSGRLFVRKGLPYAYLKISEGCDRSCSYCAIPLIRGRHRSVPISDLVSEASSLASQGVRELVLIAQDTTFYGLDIYGRRALAELLRALSAVEGIEWLRIHYSYPQAFPEDVLEEMATNPKVCRYIDIPLQHIADPVLSAMRRHIGSDATRALVKKMREKVPGVVLRTTMIVGHPGEGRKEFLQLLDFLDEAKFERLGAFMYSEEEGTWGADNLRDSVGRATKQRRLSALMERQRGISFAFNQSRIGSEEKVLIDSFSDGVFVCRSEFESPEVDGEILLRYDPSCFGGAEPWSMIGEFVNVRITGAGEYDLIAECIDG